VTGGTTDAVEPGAVSRGVAIKRENSKHNYGISGLKRTYRGDEVAGPKASRFPLVSGRVDPWVTRRGWLENRASAPIFEPNSARVAISARPREGQAPAAAYI
jgi:hypothetical protein